MESSAGAQYLVAVSLFLERLILQRFDVGDMILFVPSLYPVLRGTSLPLFGFLSLALSEISYFGIPTYVLKSSSASG
jgi:hypothetical protein